MPDLTLVDPGGKSLRLATQTGQPVLVNLWATWCAPCVAEMPALDRLAGAQAGKLRIITISQDMAPADGGKTVERFLRAHGVAHLPAWLDPAGNAAMAYGVTTLPTSIYYDAQGHEVWRWSGAKDWGVSDSARLLLPAR